MPTHQPHFLLVGQREIMRGFMNRNHQLGADRGVWYVPAPGSARRVLKSRGPRRQRATQQATRLAPQVPRQLNTDFTAKVSAR
jgi:hypothetical protein